MIVIFVSCMNKSSIWNRLASICSVSVEDVFNSVSGIFLAYLPDLMREMVWFEKAKTENTVKGLDEFTQKLALVAALIFTLSDVKGEAETKQQQPCYLCYDHSLDSGWSSCGGIISFLKTILECYYIECSLSPMRSVHCIISATEIYFRIALSTSFEAIYKNQPQALEYVQPHVSYLSPKLIAHLLG